MHEFKSHGPDALAELSDVLTEQLCLIARLPDHEAREIAQMATDYMSFHWGGVMLYFPKGHMRRLTKRDKEIFDAFNGRNKVALARQFGVTPRQVERIVAMQRALDRAARQGDMFGALGRELR